MKNFLTQEFFVLMDKFYCTGALGRTRKENICQVMKEKRYENEVTSYNNNNIGKFKDKRDVLLISSKYKRKIKFLKQIAIHQYKGYITEIAKIKCFFIVIQREHLNVLSNYLLI